MSESLKLTLQTQEDLTVASALLQDAAIVDTDIIWIPSERRFALIGNRFRWEKRRWFRKPKGERVRTALHLDGILAAKLKNIDLGEKGSGDTLSLLAIVAEKHGELTEITFTFSGGPAIRLQAECVDGLLTDIGDSWDALGKPKHS
ncbi:hypothetical protein GCM10017044_10140 [Kordiimonas sediminis]|uniref:DUF2948 family protein n=1 Tax=Kordiimonas sediminis TaxID=1735581 RepID=A0A919AN02_9PROT|nr:DUF2948 family protein [Kordiimonas sediminis]GHF17701.1 hypothetical protein GCM10017044_10140 [Kordiimonas sediminis]